MKKTRLKNKEESLSKIWKKLQKLETELIKKELAKEQRKFLKDLKKLEWAGQRSDFEYSCDMKTTLDELLLKYKT